MKSKSWASSIYRGNTIDIKRPKLSNLLTIDIIISTIRSSCLCCFSATPSRHSSTPRRFPPRLSSTPRRFLTVSPRHSSTPRRICAGLPASHRWFSVFLF
ncbi:hypothetical protein Dimus_017536 [Dionaea muscipula]